MLFSFDLFPNLSGVFKDSYCWLFAKSCLTLCDPMDCGPPSSCVLGILLARILEEVALQADSLPGSRCELPGEPLTESSEAKHVLVTLLLQFYLFWFFGCKACGILAALSGISPTSPALEGEVVTTGLLGKSLLFVFEEWLIVWIFLPFSFFKVSLHQINPCIIRQKIFILKLMCLFRNHP